MHPSSFIDITQDPYFADPTGSCECTKAIIQALDDVTEITRMAIRRTIVELEQLPREGVHYYPTGVENKLTDGEIFCNLVSRLPYLPIIYFPEGTYLVSDTLCYSHRDLHSPNGNELNMQIRLRGAGAGKSIIRLVDNAPGFGVGSEKAIISFMPAETSNVAMSNYCENLCIVNGRGNPGAVGLDFFANNSGAARNLRFISDDGQGFAGLQLGHSTYSGVLLKHIEVEGFDHGLHVDSGNGSMFAHAEDITTRNQNVSGVTVGSVSLSLRNLKTIGVPVGLSCTKPQGHTVLVDSRLEVTGERAIDRQEGFLYVSNVETAGFEDAGQIETLVHPDIQIGEARDRMPRLPIEETPVWQPHGRSTGVRDFGALGNDANDDSPAIQQAMDSGATEILFEPGRYLINTPVVIPSHVEHVDFNFCDIVAGIDLRSSDLEGFVIRGKAEDAPLFIERLFGWEQWSGTHCTFTHASPRTLCLKDIHTQTLKLYRNTIPGGKVFLDNVATTTGVHPGTDVLNRCNAVFKGQKVWARQFNPERGWPMIINDGGDLVLMGYKSEGKGAVIESINHARTEVLGGHMNIGRKGEVAFVSKDSQIRISTACQNRNSDGYYDTVVRTINDGLVTEIKSKDLPLRGPCKDGVYQCVLPLY